MDERQVKPGTGTLEGPHPTRPEGESALSARVRGTDLPVGLTLVLVGLGLPRTVLADLGIVEPESGLLYYLLALTPFAAWLAVALKRRSARPFWDFVVVGALYGVSLLVVHQVLWSVGPSLGHNPPESAISFANQFTGGWRDLALRSYTSGIAVAIGLGAGLVVAVVAVIASLWRSRGGRERSATRVED